MKWVCLILLIVALVLLFALPVAAQVLPESPTWENLKVPAILGGVAILLIQIFSLKNVAQILAERLARLLNVKIDFYSILVNLFAVLLCFLLVVLKDTVDKVPIVWANTFRLAIEAWAASTAGYEAIKNFLRSIGILPPSPSGQARLAGWKWV
jgi:hypothetical protein